MAMSGAQSLDAFLIERLASAAARSSAPTWSTERTPRMSEPRWASDTVTAIWFRLCVRRATVSRPADDGRLAAAGLEAVQAVDGTAPGRHERNLGQPSTAVADHIVHDARRPPATAPATTPVGLAPGVAAVHA